jgi:1-deoxy-D-xylulose-5-phosphate reductoisomerase
MNSGIFNYKDGNLKFEKLNGLNFIKPNIKKFPVVKLLNKIPNKQSYFETILISINDFLVDKYLRGDINYRSLKINLMKLSKIPYFTRYYKLMPKNIIDIKNMVIKVNTYLNKININEN